MSCNSTNSSESLSCTTAQLLSPPGKGGIAVILLRGPKCRQFLSTIFRPWKSHGDFSQTDRLQLGHLVDPQGTILDEAIVHQADGQVEINIHGGPVVVQKVLACLKAAHCELRIALRAQGPERSRGADCGFSRTGLSGEILSLGNQDDDHDSGCAGLPAVHPLWGNPAIGCEMLELLPRCQSMLAVEAISRQWSGGLSELVRNIRNILSYESYCGAGVPPASTPSRAGLPVLSNVAANSAATAPATASNTSIANELARAADGLAIMQRLLQPCEVVLAGPPNAGKSTLANLLTGRQVSIVHQTPGTTRDYVRELALLDGVPVWITDTAGLWDSPAGDCPHRHDVENQSMRHAQEQIAQADLVVWLWSEPDLPGAMPGAMLPRSLRKHALSDQLPKASNILHVLSKCDLHGGERRQFGKAHQNPNPPPGPSPCDPFELAISAHTGDGIAELKQAIRSRLGLDNLDLSQPRAFTSRQAELLISASRAISEGKVESAQLALDSLLMG